MLLAALSGLIVRHEFDNDFAQANEKLFFIFSKYLANTFFIISLRFVRAEGREIAS